MLPFSSARKLAEQTNRNAQRHYKHQYDKTARNAKFKIGDYFAQDETGKHRKWSQPWHGPYRVISRRDQLASKIYFQMMQTYRYISPKSNTVLPHFQQDFIGIGTKGQNQEDFLNMFLNN